MLRLLALSLFAAVLPAFAAPEAGPADPVKAAAGEKPAVVADAKPASPATATTATTGAATVATTVATTVSATSATPATSPTPAVAPAPVKFSFSQCHVDGPYIAITFDDGPEPTQTPRLLKMLRDRGIKATFFMVGQCVAQNPEIAKQVLTEGHEVANHSWNHPLLTKMSTEAVHDQLDRTHNVITQVTGVAPTLMRPPYGGFSAQQKAWAHATWGYKVIIWDVDTLDWKHHSPAKTEAITMANTRSGSIILCHDIHKTTVDAMPATLDHLLAKGFKFVTVSELIKMNHEPVPTEKKAAPAKTAAKPLKAKEAATAVTSLEDLEKKPVKAGAKKK